MKHGSLFSGIGGFELAAEWMGWDNIFHCEWNEFGQKVLKHHFPKSISYADITKTDFSIHRGTIDILTGGFPCQPYSTAGKRLGKEDERHLWPEMLRAIREIEPRWVVGENVRGLVSWSGGLVFEEVQTDLEAQGYEVQPFLLPAAGVNAPHRRDRIWFVAFKDTNSNGWDNIKRKEESGIGEQRNSCTGDNERLRADDDKIGSIANSEDSRCGGWEREQCAIRKWELFSGEQRGGTLGCEVEGCSRKWIATNTKSKGPQKLSSEDKGWENRRLDNDGKIEYATDTNCEMLEHRNGCGENGWDNKEIRTESFNGPRKWETFPTVAPICNGDDGLSNRLDSITFSKWRNESIKAGGNAIVPQVAQQIFKAIQEYERCNSRGL